MRQDHGGKTAHPGETFSHHYMKIKEISKSPSL